VARRLAHWLEARPRRLTRRACSRDGESVPTSTSASSSKRWIVEATAACHRPRRSDLQWSGAHRRARQLALRSGDERRHGLSMARMLDSTTMSGLEPAGCGLTSCAP
jgi:hypothetical protein